LGWIFCPTIHILVDFVWRGNVGPAAYLTAGNLQVICKFANSCVANSTKHVISPFTGPILTIQIQTRASLIMIARSCKRERGFIVPPEAKIGYVVTLEINFNAFTSTKTQYLTF
jgi:hypothetical protein